MFHRLVIAMGSTTVPVRVAIPGVSDAHTRLGAFRRISRLGICPLRRIATLPHCRAHLPVPKEGLLKRVSRGARGAEPVHLAPTREGRRGE